MAGLFRLVDPANGAVSWAALRHQYPGMIQRVELAQVLRRLRRDRAPGPDQVPAEF